MSGNGGLQKLYIHHHMRGNIAHPFEPFGHRGDTKDTL